MKLANLFRPKWLHSDASVRLAAMAKISDPKVLYRIATCSPDERLRLEAAHRLNDPTLLVRLARTAIHTDIRFEAALLIQDETTLAAMALKTWQPSQGEMAVIHIDNAILLHRLARSARQDTIRLAAALKLNDTALLHQIARSTNDIQIRWKVAHHLNDPHLLAEIACFKPNDSRLNDLHCKAQTALQQYLEHCYSNMDKTAMCKIIKSVALTQFKIDAFLKLPSLTIPPEIIRHMSHQDFYFAENKDLQKMLNNIRQRGWRIQNATKAVQCRQCHGAGKYSFQSISAENACLAYDMSACTECRGSGRQLVNIVTCKHPLHPDATFVFPPIESAHTKKNKNSDPNGSESALPLEGNK